MTANERDHIGGSLDAGKARIEHELCHTCRRLDLGLKNIRLQRVQKALLEQLGSHLIRHRLSSFDEHLVGDTLRLCCEDRHPDCRKDVEVVSLARQECLTFVVDRCEESSRTDLVDFQKPYAHKHAPTRDFVASMTFWVKAPPMVLTPMIVVGLMLSIAATKSRVGACL